jgi:hypothetical protein
MYLHKYLKYKNKYLELVNQKGGDIPNSSILKDINLFVKDSHIEKYLNPIYGFIYYYNNFIPNNYIFYDKSNIDNKIGLIIKTLFIQIYNIFRPIQKIIRELKPIEIGKFIALLYLFKFYNFNHVLKNKLDKLNKKFSKNECFKKEIAYYKFYIDKGSINKNLNFIYNIIKASKLVDTQSSKLVDTLPEPFFNFNDDIFKIILVLLWWVTNDKSGIKKYYEGINETLIFANNLLEEKIKLINIPYNFESIEFSRDELTNDINFEKALILTVNDNLIKIYSYEKSITPFNQEYSDCGETVVRNFINIILFNIKKNNFNIELLKKLDGKCNLIEYYTIFNNFNKQSSENKLLIFNKLLNARDAWSEIVSNHDNVNYSEVNCNYKYNIKPGLNKNNTMPNMFQVIINLFNNIINFDFFIKKINKENCINFNFKDFEINEGFGDIIITSINGMYKMFLTDLHYEIELIKIKEKINLENLDTDQKEIIKLLNGTNINDDNFMYNKWQKEDLISAFNNEVFNDKLYNQVFNYIYINYTSNEKSNIQLNIGKINNICNYNLSQFNLSIICKCTKNEKQIISLTFGKWYNLPLDKPLSNIITLQELNLGLFNKSLNKSLNNLINLKILIFGNNYNIELNESLNNLINLQELIFGNNFNNGNQPLGKSLINLKKLQKIIFKDRFTNENQSIEESLNYLINLQEITFGYKFNNGKNILDLRKLSKLKKIIKLDTLNIICNDYVEIINN